MATITALLAAIAASHRFRSAIRDGAIALAVLLFLLALRRSGEHPDGRAERFATAERIRDVQLRTLDGTARRPRDRAELAEWLRCSRF